MDFEEDIVKRITCRPFFLNGSLEIVVHILRFPIGDGEPVKRRVSRRQGQYGSLLGSVVRIAGRCGIYLLCTRIQQESEGIADRAFVSDVVLIVLLKRCVVIPDNFMRGFEIELRHVGYDSISLSLARSSGDSMFTASSALF